MRKSAFGGASIGSLEWHLQQNERNAASSAAAAEVRRRDITMIVAAEGSRDLQLAQAAAESASRLCPEIEEGRRATGRPLVNDDPADTVQHDLLQRQEETRLCGSPALSAQSCR